MKKLFLLSLLIVSLSITTFGKSTCNETNEVKNTLKAMVAADQAARRDMMNQCVELLIDENAAIDASECMNRIDSVDCANQQYVANLLDECGWPAYFTADESKALLTLISHADFEYQMQYAHLVKAQAVYGNLASTDYAMLENRINQRAGESTEIPNATETGNRPSFAALATQVSL